MLLPLFQKMTMRRKLFICLLATAVGLLSSCGSKKKSDDRRSEYIRPASMNYSSSDTTAINDLVNKYVAAFNAKDFNACADMLYTVAKDSLHPLTAQQREGFLKAYEQMPNYGCKVKSFVLRSDKNNEVKLSVMLISKGNFETGEGCTHLSLNPVVKDGKWYLTLLDKNAEGVEDVYGNGSR